MRTSAWTPRKYQSGEIDITGLISKRGDAGVRALLFEAAHIVLTKPVKKAGALKAADALPWRTTNRAGSAPGQGRVGLAGSPSSCIACG